MNRKNNTYSIFHHLSALLMMLALTWLTISTPFVFASKQKLANEHSSINVEIPLSANEEETTSPPGNGTEEKAPNSSSTFSEEYLHDNHKSDYFFLVASQYHKFENAGIYIAFHGELHVPPPNVS